MNKFPEVFTDEEITDWLDSQSIAVRIAILEKLYKDTRDQLLHLMEVTNERHSDVVYTSQE